MAAIEQYCTFWVGEYYFGVEVVRVQEVLRHQQMTGIPLTTDVIQGLINLRGQIVTAVDLRRRLEVEPRDGERLPMNVVIRTGEGVVSFLVDEIGDVVEVTEDSFEQSPDTLDGLGRELIRGVYKLEDQLLLILDVDKAADISTFVQA